MRNKLKLFCLVLAIAGSGCSTVSRHDYVSEQVSDEQFLKESAACEMEGKKYQASTGPGMWNANSPYNSMYDSCMRSKGYKKK